MRILLFPSVNVLGRRLEPYVPYGLLSLQSMAAQKKELCVDIAFPSSDLLKRTFDSSSELVECIIETTDISGYDAFGLSTVCNSFYHSLGIAKRLKKILPNTIVFMGGPYVTKLAKRILDEFNFIDGIFVGESETSFFNFISQQLNRKDPFAGIRGVYTREHTFVEALPIDDLNSLPRIVSAKDYFRWLFLTRTQVPGAGAAPLEASRGCPLQCSFCSTRQIWGSSVRRKSAQRLVSEMKEINAVTGDTFFTLIGDNLGVPIYPFMKFCNEMIEFNSEFTWGCSLKLDGLEEYHLQRMWEAGCRYIFIGVESSSQETLNRVNKAARVDKEIRSIKTAISMGFKVETSFITDVTWKEQSVFGEERN